MLPLKNKFKLAVIGFLIAANFLIWFALFREERAGVLRVAFLDVGQGDAIFIEAPNGNQMLVDGGSGRQILPALSKVMPFYDKSIDVILATHPDKDHIGGLPSVLARYKIETVIESGASSDTAVFREFQNKITENRPRKVLAHRGMTVNLGGGAYFYVFFPDVDTSGFREKNEASIVGKLAYKKESFLLTGDSPIKIEQHLISLNGKNLHANVLKLGHHGSRTSSGENFLGFVSPEYAIISAGCKNSYGHPHREVLALLEKFKIRKLSTCESGTIIFTTDGEELSYKTVK